MPELVSYRGFGHSSEIVEARRNILVKARGSQAETYKARQARQGRASTTRYHASIPTFTTPIIVHPVIVGRSCECRLPTPPTDNNPRQSSRPWSWGQYHSSSGSSKLMGSWFAIAVLSPRSMRAGFCLQGEQRASPAVVKLERTNFLQCLDIFGQVAFLKALP